MSGALLKLLLGGLTALCLAACLWVFEASSAAAIALGLLVDAGETESDVVRANLLERGERTLLTNWSRPADWHAGAAEVLSATYYLRAASNEEVGDYAASADYAARAATLSPVQPNAFIRLAALAERGYPNPICDARGCIERAFIHARVLEPEAGCTRLQIGARTGLIGADDPRVMDYLHSGISRRTAATCLAAVFPAGLTFRLAMQAGPPR